MQNEKSLLKRVTLVIQILMEHSNNVNQICVNYFCCNAHGIPIFLPRLFAPGQVFRLLWRSSPCLSPRVPGFHVVTLGPVEGEIKVGKSVQTYPVTVTPFTVTGQL